MNKMMKSKMLLYVFIYVLCVMVLVGCSSSNQKLKQIMDKGEIVIITSPDYVPFEFIDLSKSGSDKYVGSDIELMKYIASELGVKLRIEVADFNTTLASLGLGTADLAISGYTYKPDRAENYEMSNSYYAEGSQGILILKSNQERYDTFSKLNVKDVKVGAQSGSLQYDYLSSQLDKLKAEEFDTIPNGVALLNNKVIEGIALPFKVAEIIMKKNPDMYYFLEEEFDVDPEDVELFVFAKKGETELIQRINEIIAKVKEQKLYEKWDQEATELAIELGLK